VDTILGSCAALPFWFGEAGLCFAAIVAVNGDQGLGRIISPIKRAMRSSNLNEEVRMKRKGMAAWKGGLVDGQGGLSTESGVLKETPYSFRTRFDQGVGTNPEELIAAAHAGCFSMALANQLATAGMRPQSIRTTATVSLDKTDKGFAITGVHLDVVATVPGVPAAAFQEQATTAKAGCLVSQILNVPVTLDARLEDAAGGS
jgi:lipoyl-dependent peroxiredoxin